MNRNLLVTIAVVFIILALGGAYVFMNENSAGPAAHATPSPSDLNVEMKTTEKGSLKSFMSMTGTQKCEFSDAENGNSGEVYIDSGKMRGDFLGKAGGKETTSHMINDGSDIYFWMDDQQTGFKTSLAAIEQMSNSEGMTGVNQLVDINKQVDYKCENWSSDPVKFAVPSEIKFQDMTKMMNDAMNRMPAGSANASISPSGNAEACAACNNLTGDAQTQCKRALKCN